MKEIEKNMTAHDATRTLNDVLARIGDIKAYNDIIDRVVMAYVSLSEKPDPVTVSSVYMMTEHINEEIMVIEQSIFSLLDSPSKTE